MLRLTQKAFNWNCTIKQTRKAFPRNYSKQVCHLHTHFTRLECSHVHCLYKYDNVPLFFQEPSRHASLECMIRRRLAHGRKFAWATLTEMACSLIAVMQSGYWKFAWKQKDWKTENVGKSERRKNKRNAMVFARQIKLQSYAVWNNYRISRPEKIWCRNPTFACHKYQTRCRKEKLDMQWPRKFPLLWGCNATLAWLSKHFEQCQSAGTARTYK